MADLLKISDATALAMHSMVHLAMDPEALPTTAEIAGAFGCSKHHLAKVHQRLVRAGLLYSARGPTGGVGLAKDPAEITLLDIYEALEGPIASHACLFGNDECPRADCAFRDLLPTISRQVQSYFRKTTLAKLAKGSNWEQGK